MADESDFDSVGQRRVPGGRSMSRNEGRQETMHGVDRFVFTGLESAMILGTRFQYGNNYLRVRLKHNGNLFETEMDGNESRRSRMTWQVLIVDD